MLRSKALRTAALRGGTHVRALRNLVELDPFNKTQPCQSLGYAEPLVAVDAFIAPNATLVGAVEVGDASSVWYGAVLRGDLARVRVGSFSSIGDRCVLSTARYARRVSYTTPRAPYRSPYCAGACRLA
jgi:hypothetical protein